MPNLEEFLTFPFKDSQSRKNFILGGLMMWAGTIIPILPHLIAYGYIAKVVKLVAKGEKPTMPAWDKPRNLLINGLRLFVFKLFLTLPFLLALWWESGSYWGWVLFEMMFGKKRDIFQFSTGNEIFDPAIVNQIFYGGMTLLTILFLAAILTPTWMIVASMPSPVSTHVVVTEKLSDGFDVKAWWPIFRANPRLFMIVIAAAFVVLYSTSTLSLFIMRLGILVCVLPFLMPILAFFIFYVLLLTDLLAAQAYRQGLLTINSQNRFISPDTEHSAKET